jgi:hypothetical protein
MKLLQIHELVGGYSTILSTGDIAKDFASTQAGILPLETKSHTEIVWRIRRFHEIVRDENMPVATQLSRDFLAVVEGAGETETGKKLDRDQLMHLKAMRDQLISTFYMELSGKQFYLLSQSDAALIDPRARLWGPQFAANFPSALYDLDESAKCLAFGMGTAAVFHLMRITEIGLRAVHQCLGITVAFVGTDRNWGNIVNRIRDNISQRGKTWPEQELFQEFHALLVAVKDAWRNATMHVENKYTPEEAEHIYHVVRGFMKKIASRMDETGAPKA